MHLRFCYRFETAHRFVHAPSPSCQTPHGHTWSATVVLQPRHPQLDAHNMLGEFQHLKAHWRQFIETVDHSFLYNSQDPIVPAMKEHIPGFRGLAFPGDPTTEMIAVLFLHKAQQLFSHNTANVELVAIEIQETPVNSLRLDLKHPIYTETLGKLKNFRAWWQDSSPESRQFIELSSTERNES